MEVMKKHATGGVRTLFFAGFGLESPCFLPHRVDHPPFIYRRCRGCTVVRGGKGDLLMSDAQIIYPPY